MTEGACTQRLVAATAPPLGSLPNIAASRTSSEPVREPVWDAAAFAAWTVRPGLMTMIGFVSATSRAAERNARASPMVSM